jgi:CHAT domain-containing protein
MNRISEAEPLIRRALAIDETIFGPDHPTVATRLNNLAQLLQATGPAELLYRRALAIYEKHLGPDHPNVATALNNLAALRAELGDWAEAARLHRLAVPIMTGARGKEGSGLDKAVLVQGRWRLRAAARAVYRDGASSADARAEGFVLAQWALQTGAADALAQMGVRFAKGAGPLSVLVRARQDLTGQRQGEDKRLLAAVARADAKATDFSRTAIAGLDGKLAAIDARLAAEFPEYAQLSNPRPLSIALVQSLLGEDEVLVVFLDIPGFGNLSEETLAWVVTKAEARWTSIPHGTVALAERVAKLRCGLDREGQWTWVREQQRWEAKAENCRALKRDGLASNEALPFDLNVAHELYASLLAPFADLTNGKRLFVVPSGPLTSLPFSVLVTEATPSNPGGVAPSWLVLTQSITVLPAVGSLQALRKLPPSQARSPYIAFGSPLLDGGNPDGTAAKLARAKQSCQTEGQHLGMLQAARPIPRLSAIFRGAVDIGALRAQTPLPETADELCAVAEALGTLQSPGDENETVWLGARATETNLKALSRSGKLARYRVLHFATHGLLADESEAILNSAAEPALLLSPPQVDATREQLEEDDGLLLASEVAQLELDADWIVLSACNTAAGEKGDADALAGLARAFFYAKARALLVSHWYVNSEAAVKLTTGAFAELRVNPKIGRAEALRRSIVRLITLGRPDEQQPEYWAPFVLVGEDAAG